MRSVLAGRRRLLLAAAAASLGCRPAAGAGDRAPVTITVSAAADLTLAFQELGKVFEQQTGVRPVFNFGSTGQLAQQIERGAPIDVFAAANVAYVDDLERRGLILPDTKAVYAEGRLTLWWRAGSPVNVERMEDLARPEVQRIAIANPDHAPYGVAAREALQAAGVWEQVRPKLVLGEDVRQTLQYAQTGNVDVAIVALSLSVQRGEDGQGGGRWVLVPRELHRPIRQALAVIKGTRHEREARAFATFVNAPEGRAIMRKYGFLLPGEEDGR
jgi:molybdate transport system substrate-binding protein